MHYQPQLDLHSGAILRCEALLRWRHPEFGLLSPYASLTGTRWADDISGLEGWAAAEVCRQGARWDEHGLPVQIALNVSASFLLRPRFVSSLEQELDRSGLSPYLLAIDLPVRGLATSTHRMEQVAGALTDTGIGVIIDGVGAMGVSRLGSLGAEGWKIDLGRPGPVRAGLHPSVGVAVEEAHKAGARAIAKAVEDDARLAEVRALGFDEVFGNVVSPPLSGRAARDEFRPAPPRIRSPFGPSPTER
ncbi:EAL domain-containing protein [Aquihabitans daechungensis]|uniref:EAL domain-containing protein n=1 Tax=Aquihabitans daechungensis TaxID=1052257 RepID=UPI003B9F6A4B